MRHSIEVRQEVNVTGLELVQILKQVKRGTFSNVHMEVIQSFPRKTDNPFYGKVIKVSKGNFYIGGNYKVRVENSNDEIEDFTPQKCTVGEKIEDSPVQYNTNKDRYYLQYEWFEEVPPKPEYFFEGNEVEKMLFRDYLKVYIPNKYGVNVQSVMINNIKGITVNHVRYTVTELIPENPPPRPSKKKKVEDTFPLGVD